MLMPHIGTYVRKNILGKDPIVGIVTHFGKFSYNRLVQLPKD